MTAIDCGPDGSAPSSSLIRAIFGHILFNQTLAVPIALLMGGSNGQWIVSAVVATTFAQAVGGCCWVSAHLLAERIGRLPQRQQQLAVPIQYFVAGVIGSEIARQVCIHVFDYNMRGAYSALISLAIGASVAVLVGVIMTRVRQLRVTLAAAESALRERELTEARLKQAKTDAELAALQARINPHFLFNTLNSIAALISEDPARAEKVTWELSSLFRYALEANRRGFVTLGEELSIVRRYLEIEQVRLGDRLTYDIQVDAGLEAEEVPVLLLQPLVENAIKHGIAPSVAGGRVQVTGRREADRGVLTVTDTSADGASQSDNPSRLPHSPQSYSPHSPDSPDPPQYASGTGEGLDNVRQRLETLYGSGASVSLSRNDGTTATTVIIPLSRQGRLVS